jgi:hypothetical protein
MESDSLEDYTDIIATFKKAIERGATAFSQAKIHRALGEFTTAAMRRLSPSNILKGLCASTPILG